jgi:N-acetylglucosaminyldiphosphoundecaprenol N-acetyl-beta-D-mannosaminyltransferase
LTAVGDAAAFAHAMSGDLRAAFPADNLRQAASAYTVAHAADRHLALFQACLQRSFSRRAFGLRFSRQTASAIADRLITEAASLRGGLVITPNLDHIRHLRQPDFFAAASSAAIVCADGWPVAFYAALKGAAPFRRVTGCDILHALAIHPGRSSRRIVIVTECCATTGVLEQWLHARGLARCWSVETAPPGLGADAEAQARLARAIAAAHPHVLILTLGAPVSEVFVHRYQDVLGRCWALCVGQAVRVELGLTQRAPAWLRAAGLEWAWRCAQEPRRLGPRYGRALLWFPRAILCDLVQRK